jgi:hypothetical protein
MSSATTAARRVIEAQTFTVVSAQAEKGLRLAFYRLNKYRPHHVISSEPISTAHRFISSVTLKEKLIIIVTLSEAPRQKLSLKQNVLTVRPPRRRSAYIQIFAVFTSTVRMMS